MTWFYKTVFLEWSRPLAYAGNAFLEMARNIKTTPMRNRSIISFPPELIAQIHIIAEWY
jgi:hypothetical protein